MGKINGGKLFNGLDFHVGKEKCVCALFINLKKDYVWDCEELCKVWSSFCIRRALGTV